MSQTNKEDMGYIAIILSSAPPRVLCYTRKSRLIGLRRKRLMTWSHPGSNCGYVWKMAILMLLCRNKVFHAALADRHTHNNHHHINNCSITIRAHRSGSC
jgi:hypothetical protein